MAKRDNSARTRRTLEGREYAGVQGFSVAGDLDPQRAVDSYLADSHIGPLEDGCAEHPLDVVG